MMDDFEKRLRATLGEHAEAADPQLYGPELRRLAAERNRPGARLRRTAPVLATAAAVAAIGVTAAVLTSPDHTPPPIQPGRMPVVPATTPPTRMSTPNPTPSAPSSSGRPSRPRVSSVPLSPALPSGRRSAPVPGRVSSSDVPSMTLTRVGETRRPTAVIVTP